MTWIGRLRLFGGLLGVIALVAVLTLVFNHRQTEAASLNASVSSDQYVVGSAYGGTVTKQYVKDGDSVKKGDQLFTLLSTQLRQDVENGLSADNTDAYTLDTKKGLVTYKAVSDGVISDYDAKIGNALSSGAPAAKINVTNSQFVVADYLLSPRDYERVQNDAQVSILLPNDKSVDGKVTSIKVETQQGKAQTEIRVDSDALKNPATATLTKPGTPVTATVTLRPVGPLTEANELTTDFLRKIGLK